MFHFLVSHLTADMTGKNAVGTHSQFNTNVKAIMSVMLLQPRKVAHNLNIEDLFCTFWWLCVETATEGNMAILEFITLHQWIYFI